MVSKAFNIDEDIYIQLEQLDKEKAILDDARPLEPEILRRIKDYFHLQHVYHSNAIEGNSLTLSETELVIREGLTIGGKPQKDHLEAVNLNLALNFLDDLARGEEEISERVLKELHQMILRGIDDENAGKYRGIPVRISGSEFVPPEPIFLPESMEEFFDWYGTKTEEHPMIKAAEAHVRLVQIHPFIDGNGRAARLLMNLHLMRSRYPVAIIRIEDRPRYYNALEECHQKHDLSLFSELLIERVNTTLREYFRMIREQERAKEWAKNLANKSKEVSQRRLFNQYEIWKLQMENFRKEFSTRINMLVEQKRRGAFQDFAFFLNDYDIIDFEKYLDLIEGKPRELSWFFKTTFAMHERNEKFVFFFGCPSNEVKNHIHGQKTASLFISRRREGKYDKLETEQVSLREIYYNPETSRIEARISRISQDIFDSRLPGQYAEDFITEVLRNYFGF